MSLARVFEVARLEARAGVSAPAFWVLVALVCLATAGFDSTALIPSGDPSAGLRPAADSPHALATVFALVGFLFYGFLAALLAGASVTRDDEARVGDLLHSTPLTAGEWAWGKLAGVAAALAAAWVLHVLFTALLLELATPGGARLTGSFRPAAYLVPALAFGAPQFAFAAGLSFAVAVRTRRTLAVAAVPAALLLAGIFLLWGWTPAGLDPAADRMLMVLDPSGLRWLLRTPFRVDLGLAYYDAAPLAFDATFLANRQLALALPAAAALAALGRLRRTLRGGAGPAPSAAGAGATAEVERAAPSPALLAALGMTRALPGRWASALEVARAELRDLAAHPGLYLFAAVAMALAWEQGRSRIGPFDAPLRATSGGLAVDCLGPVGLLLCLALLFLAVESVHRDRAARLAPILYAAPVSTGALLLGRALAHFAGAAAILAGCAATCLANLALQAPSDLAVVPLAGVWGAVLLPTLAVWLAFVHALLSCARDRLAVYALGLGALLASALASQRPGTTWLSNWTLWGALRWSDFAVFDLHREPLAANRLLVLAAAGLLAAVAVRAFPRVEADAGRALDRLRPHRWAPAALRLAPLALALLLAGGLVASRVRAGFQGAEAERRERETRRLHAATWSGAAYATPTHVDVAVRLEPERRGMAVMGTYALVNPFPEALSALPFTVGASFGEVAWTLDGAAVAADRRTLLHVLEPPRPLPPGGTATVGFAYEAVVPRGWSRNGGGVAEFVLPSGVLLHTLGREFLPTPGLPADLGAGSERLEPKRLPADFWRADLPPAIGGRVPFTARIEVTAPSAYTATSAGEKTYERYEGGRTTVVWESRVPVRALNLVAGRWQVRRRDGAAVHFHPAHGRDVERMLAILAAARRRYSEWFAPYPWSELRIVETPDHVQRAQGFPSNVNVSEGMGFLAQDGEGVRLAEVVTAHEAAHQWWGNLLTPGDGPGAGFLIEGMADYSALLLLEAERGPRARIEYARRLETRFAENRRVDGERPIAEIADDTTAGGRSDVQDKGAWAMWMLDRHLGREATLAGLRRFIEQFRDGPDRPAVHDLLETLRPFAADPRAYQAFVDTWLFGAGLPRFRVTEARAEPAGAGWRVTATVDNAGSAPAEVEIAATRGERFEGDAESPDYREVRSAALLEPGAARTLTWTAGFAPERIVVDPDAHVLQLDREKAVAEL